MEKIYKKTAGLYPDRGNPYCPGCLHGVANKIICEVLEEMGQLDNCFCCWPIGCGGMAGANMDIDGIISLHGRACATATGVKRSAPDKLVFTYQGDGDLASIGLAETLHAANRGEHFVTIFINNGIYGMTGGQMAPTTLIGQKSTTTPGGRQAEREGYPLHMCEIINQLQAPVYIERVALDTPAHVNAAKKAIRKAFEYELAGEGYCFIEIMSNCPTNWGMSVLDSLKNMQEKTFKEFPLGVFRDKE